MPEALIYKALGLILVVSLTYYQRQPKRHRDSRNDIPHFLWY
jgi:hypothetical protein